MLLDFALLSLLLVAAHVLRWYVRLLQVILLPTPILAGFLGLAVGPQGLDLLPFERDNSRQLSLTKYPMYLIVGLFATLYLGHRPRLPSAAAAARRVGDTFFYNVAAEVGQFGVALAFGLLVLAPLFPELNPAFAMLLPAGFAGGHGTSTVIGTALAQYGWEEATSIGYTFATLGLLAGIFGGMLLINVGTRLGWARLVRSPRDLPDDERRGFLGEPQPGFGRQTTSSMALEPLTWHLGLVMIAFAGAHGVNHLWQHRSGTSIALPLFALSMWIGGGLQKLLDALRLGKYVDRQLMGRIGSCASDYLVAFGITSIQLAVVVKYAAPIAVMATFGVVFCLAMFRFVGPRICRSFWFERSLFVYGWSTGVVGTSITLLRVVDPKFRSGTLEDYGLAYLFIAPIEIGVLIFLPPLVAQGWIAAPAVVLLMFAAAAVILSARLIGWFAVPTTVLREGEGEIIAATLERA